MVKKRNGVTKEEDHLVHKYAKGDECKKDGEIHLQKILFCKWMQSSDFFLRNGDEAESIKLRCKNLEGKMWTSEVIFNMFFQLVTSNRKSLTG